MKTTHTQPAPRHPTLFTPATPTRVMVLFENTQLPEEVYILPDGTYVLKNYVIIDRDEYDAMQRELGEL